MENSDPNQGGEASKMENKRKNDAKKKNKKKSNKKKKMKSPSTSPSPTPSLPHPESPTSQGDDMAVDDYEVGSEGEDAQPYSTSVDYEADSDLEDEQSLSPGLPGSANMLLGSPVSGHKVDDCDLPPWDEGMDPAIFAADSEFMFSPGLDDFIIKDGETAAAEEEMLDNGEWSKSRKKQTGVLILKDVDFEIEGDNENDEEEFYDSPSPSAEAAARSMFDGRSSMRGQRGVDQSIAAGIEYQGPGRNYNRSE